MAEVGINNQVNKSELLLAGWHSICEKNIEYWIHRLIPGAWDFKNAKKITKAFKDKLHG